MNRKRRVQAYAIQFIIDKGWDQEFIEYAGRRGENLERSKLLKRDHRRGDNAHNLTLKRNTKATAAT